MYLYHVNHLSEELKKIDLLIEMEKAETSRVLNSFKEELLSVHYVIKESITAAKEVETRIRLSEDRLKG